MTADSHDISRPGHRVHQRIAALRLQVGEKANAGASELAEIEKSLRQLELNVSDHGAPKDASSPVADNVIANLSHELRTPLAPALLIISALQSNPALPEEVRSDLAIVREQIELEGRLIDALLDTAQLGRGEMQLRMEAVDIRMILHSVAAAGRATASLGPPILVVLAAKETIVRGDAARLTQVFTNLVNNAFKFTPPDGKIRISAEQEGAWLVVSIADSGSGIDAEAMPRVFGAFEQGANPLREGRGGLGVGLSVAKGLVALHGGELSADSEGAGHGATFRVKLPTIKAAPKNAVSPEGPPAASTRHRRSLRVLLVEDHGQSLLAMARLVRRIGHTVHTAGSVAMGAALLHAEIFDLIVADIELPDGTGWDLMRIARGIGPIVGVALSGHAGDEYIARSIEAGFAKHLIKPITSERLASAIDETAFPPTASL